MKRKVYTKIVIDLETGKTKYAEGYWYDGPWALCFDTDQDDDTGASDDQGGMGGGSGEAGGAGDTGHGDDTSGGGSDDMGYGGGDDDVGFGLAAGIEDERAGIAEVDPSGIGLGSLGTSAGVNAGRTAAEENAIGAGMDFDDFYDGLSPQAKAAVDELEAIGAKKGKTIGAIIGMVAPVPGGSLLGGFLGGKIGGKRGFDKGMRSQLEKAGFSPTEIDNIGKSVGTISESMDEYDGPGGINRDDRDVEDVIKDPDGYDGGTVGSTDEVNDGVKAARDVLTEQGYGESQIDAIEGMHPTIANLPPILLNRWFPGAFNLLYQPMGVPDQGVDPRMMTQYAGATEAPEGGVEGLGSPVRKDPATGKFVQQKTWAHDPFSGRDELLKRREGAFDLVRAKSGTGKIPGHMQYGANIDWSQVNTESGDRQEALTKDWYQSYVTKNGMPTTDEDAQSFLDAHPDLEKEYNRMKKNNPRWTPLSWAKSHLVAMIK